MSRSASPEFSEDYERVAQSRRARGKSVNESRPKWIAVSCSTPGCDRTAEIREDDLCNPEISRECLKCWSA